MKELGSDGRWRKLKTYPNIKRYKAPPPNKEQTMKKKNDTTPHQPPEEFVLAEPMATWLAYARFLLDDHNEVWEFEDSTLTQPQPNAPFEVEIFLRHKQEDTAGRRHNTAFVKFSANAVSEWVLRERGEI